MKDVTRLQKQAFKTNNPDFLRAVGSRNFDEMANCYNEMMRYEEGGASDDVDKYFFAEVLDGYVIRLPLLAKAKIKAIGKHFYYGLAKDYISYMPDECPEEDEETDLAYAFFVDDFLECKKVVLMDSITFTRKAVKQLGLSLGDIVKICFKEDIIIIDKYE